MAVVNAHRFRSIVVSGLALMFAIVLSALLAPIAWADAPKKVALVVGNSDYVNEPHLRNPANDAKAMAAALRAKGFEVIEAENASKTQFETAIVRFSEALTEGSTGLFYYAGHGMQVDGRNYLLPIDAKVQREERVRLEAVNVDDVISQMTDAKTKVSLVILDACRNNPFERRFRSVGGGLAQMNAPEGTFIAYATAPGSIAADGTGEHGIYSQALLDAMQKPGLKVEDVFKAVRINVSKTTDGVQVPWESSSLTGDFYFTPAPSGPSPAELAAQAALAKIAAAKADLERQQAALLAAAQDQVQKLIAAKADLERQQQAALKDAEPERQQAALTLSQAGGGAARALSDSDTQGSFAATLPRLSPIGSIDVQLTVQGHRVSGYGVIDGNAIPCNVAGQVEQATIEAKLICVQSVSGGGQGGVTNFAFAFKGPLARADDGTPYFRTSYEGGPPGTNLSGVAELKKVRGDGAAPAPEAADVFGTYVGEIRLPRMGIVPAILTVSDGQIAGFSTQGMACKIVGKAEGTTASFVLTCNGGNAWGAGTYGATETAFKGQFVNENGQAVLKSDFTTSERETGMLVWTAKR